MTLNIWWISGSPYAWWVLLAAEVKGLAYEDHLLSISKRENRTPEYLAMNPRGHVPLLKDGDFILTEAMAIVAYLDTKSDKTPLFGADPREAARIWEAVSQILSDLQRASEAFADPILFGRAKADNPEPIREAAAKLKTELGFFEERLESGPYLCGEALSAADIGLLPFLLFNLRAAERDIAKNLDLGLVPFAGHYPRLAAWIKRIEALPGYDKTYPPHWRT
jgi:glutathione S-transferase